jgi:oxygen-independent coproporphyrinogen-3 oxidase
VYCDFSIAVRRTTPVNEYISALKAELSTCAPADDWTLDTVYLGGGTPSRLGADGISGVLDAVRERFGLIQTRHDDGHLDGICRR